MTPVRRLAHYAMSLGVAAAGMLVVTTLAADAASAGPPTVNVYVAANHAIAMSQRIRPGIHKYVINSGGEAAFQLLQAAPGYTKAELSRDSFYGVTKGRVPALKRLEENVTALGGAFSEPGHAAVMWLKLPAGDYWAFDTTAEFRPAKILTLHVTGDRIEGGIAGTAVIRAIHEADWAAHPASIGHKGRLKFRNDSRDNHFVELFKLADGKTIEDFHRWIQKAKRGVNSPPPVEFQNGLDTGVVSPGHAMTVKYNLPPGRYVLTCFWPDADMHGMPHAFMGMYRGIRLT